MCKLHRVGEVNCVKSLRHLHVVGIIHLRIHETRNTYIYLRIHQINRVIEMQIMPCVSFKNLVADIMQLELV